MAAQRLLLSFALALLLGSTGCRSYCERHFPCQSPVSPVGAPGCVPCCPPATSYSGAPAWNAPAPVVAAPAPRSFTCTCQ